MLKKDELFNKEYRAGRAKGKFVVKLIANTNVIAH